MASSLDPALAVACCYISSAANVPPRAHSPAPPAESKALRHEFQGLGLARRIAPNRITKIMPKATKNPLEHPYVDVLLREPRGRGNEEPSITAHWGSDHKNDLPEFRRRFWPS